MAKETKAKVVAKSIQERLNAFLSEDKGFRSVGNEKPELIKTGIDNLDAILGGGIILGGLIQLVGRAGCGKSSLAAKLISSFQKKTKGNCVSLYIDSESTMTKLRLSQLGVNRPKLDPINDVMLEDVFAVIDSVIEFKKDNKETQDIPTIIVWDSIANTLTLKETTAEDPKEVIGYKARMLSLYLPKISAKLQEFKITLVAINQLRDSVGIGMMPSPVAIKGMKQSDTIPGGRTLQFATSQLIYMQDVGNIEERTHGFDGKEVDVHCIKNKAFPPLIKTRMSFSYMGGYSSFWSAFALLKAEKLIVAGGAWYSMKGFEKKFQASKCAQLYTENESFRKAFNNLIGNYTQSIAEKYTNQLESCNIDDVIDKALNKGGAITDGLLQNKALSKKIKDDKVTVEPKSKPTPIVKDSKVKVGEVLEADMKVASQVLPNDKPVPPSTSIDNLVI